MGERSLHEFLCALYADMYRNPGDYRMTESPELAFDDGEWYKARPDMKKAMRKNAHVIKSLQVLFEIGRLATLRGDTLVLSVPERLAVVTARGQGRELEEVTAEVLAGNAGMPVDSLASPFT